MSTPIPSSRFALVMPVKGWHRAKTRLHGFPAGVARELAAAFALDAIEAASGAAGVAQVYVVTDQADFAPTDVTVLPDEGEGDLNAALRAAVSRVRRRRPELAVAAMCADVPCLRANDLSAALAQPPGADRWFVADHLGTGTTLLAVAAGHDLHPLFGAGSADRHRASGAVAVEASVPSLRLDVDTPEDLGRAVALGAGRHTRAVLARHRAALDAAAR